MKVDILEAALTLLKMLKTALHFTAMEKILVLKSNDVLMFSVICPFIKIYPAKNSHIFDNIHAFYLKP